MVEIKGEQVRGRDKRRGGMHFNNKGEEEEDRGNKCEIREGGRQRGKWDEGISWGR